MNENDQSKPAEETKSSNGRISLPVIVGAVPGVAFVVSVVHEWMYFGVIDHELIRLMQIGDYFSSLFKWVPGTLIAMFVGLALMYATRRVDGGMTEDELLARSPTPRFTKFLRGFEKYALRAMVFLGIPYFVLTSPSPFFPFIGFSLSVGWVYFADWITGHARVLGWLDRRSRIAVSGLPALAILIGTFGAFDATMTLSVPKGDREVVLKNGLAINVVLLRPLEVGLVVRQPETEQILVYPWAEVLELRQVSKMQSMQAVGCYLFETFCNKPK